MPELRVAARPRAPRSPVRRRGGARPPTSPPKPTRPGAERPELIAIARVGGADSITSAPTCPMPRSGSAGYGGAREPDRSGGAARRGRLLRLGATAADPPTSARASPRGDERARPDGGRHRADSGSRQRRPRRSPSAPRPVEPWDRALARSHRQGSMFGVMERPALARVHRSSTTASSEDAEHFVACRRRADQLLGWRDSSRYAYGLLASTLIRQGEVDEAERELHSIDRPEGIVRRRLVRQGRRDRAAPRSAAAASRLSRRRGARRALRLADEPRLAP